MSKPKVPTNILELRGSKRAKYGRELEPQVTATKFDAPGYLSNTANKYWQEFQGELNSMGCYSDADRVGLALISDAMAEYIMARTKCEEEGYVQDLQRGGYSVSPWVKIKNTAFDQVSALLKQYGFTPSARAHLTIPNKKKESDDPLEKVLNQ